MVHEARDALIESQPAEAEAETEGEGPAAAWEGPHMAHLLAPRLRPMNGQMATGSGARGASKRTRPLPPGRDSASSGQSEDGAG